MHAALACSSWGLEQKVPLLIEKQKALGVKWDCKILNAFK